MKHICIINEIVLSIKCILFTKKKKQQKRKKKNQNL